MRGKVPQTFDSPAGVFAPAKPMFDVGGPTMAMDDALTSFGSTAFGTLQSGNFFDGDYPVAIPMQVLSVMAQRAEFWKISDTPAVEMTRRWITIASTDDRSDKSERIAGIIDDLKRFKVRDAFRDAIRKDGQMGRGHVYLDFGDISDAEALTPIGNGRDKASLAKIRQGSLRAIRSIDPVWCYPLMFGARDALSIDFYKPQNWSVGARRVHASRLLTIVAREVPDLLKPAYSFGGLSLTQMAAPYVQNWLRTRQDVSDLVHAFNTYVLKTNMAAGMQGGMGGAYAAQAGGGDGASLDARVALFTLLANNRGVFLLDKDGEDFGTVSAQLGTLDKLQAQAQEQMAAVAGQPLVKMFGITPSGLNACLPGDTAILTGRGQVPIRDVTLDDKVMTRRGFAPLTFSGVTKYATELIEIRTESTVLRCTANHPIWMSSTNEFVPAENVRVGDILLSTGEKNVIQKMRHRSHGVANGGGKEQMATTLHGISLKVAPSPSIGECGKRIADLCRMDSTFTTRTGTKRTIKSLIFSLCSPAITWSTTRLICGLGDQLASNPLFAGNAARLLSSRNFQAERSSARTSASRPIAEETDPLRHGQCLNASVRRVGGLFWHFEKTLSSVAENARQMVEIVLNTCEHIISSTQKNSTSRVVGVRNIPAAEDVYDLTVADGYLPEFFANGILTHNSSDGEIRVWYDHCHAMQEDHIRDPLETVVDIIQLNRFGDIDPTIQVIFEPLWAMSEKDRAELEKSEMETDKGYVDMGALWNHEVRAGLARDPDNRYQGIDVDDVPDDEPGGEKEQPEGGENGQGATGEAGDEAGDPEGDSGVKAIEGLFRDPPPK